MGVENSELLTTEVFREFEKRIDRELRHISDVAELTRADARTAADKAEASIQNRFDSVNEFNQRMKDLTVTFANGKETRDRLDALLTRIERLENMKSHIEGRLWMLGVIILGIQMLQVLFSKYWGK
jgi:uncharacterized membrane protein YheB (UPF0754 family)